MTTVSTPPFEVKAGLNPLLRVAAYLSVVHGLAWAILFFRWLTFGNRMDTPGA